MKPVTYLITLLAGLLIFLGLPLLGWGVGAVAAFFASPARLAFAVVILLLQLFALIYNPQVGRGRENRQSDTPQHKIDLLLIQILSLTIVILAPFSDRRAIGSLNVTETVRYLGIVLMVPGFLLMQIAEKYLGKQFSVAVTVQKSHQLVQDGPYQWVRHPRYLGILMFFTGIALVFRSWLALVAVVALGVVLVWRVSAEEALMRQEFGQVWDAYCATSWRILPFIY